MNKGKAKKEKDHLSILLIPHTEGKIREWKFSGLYFKLPLILASVLIVLIILGILITYTLYENNKLKNDISKISDLNVEQKNLINEKINQIEELSKKEEDINQRIKDYQEKYKEITESYLSNNVSRAGIDRAVSSDPRSFVNDIKELKDILDRLSKTTTTNSADLSETQNKLNKYTDSIPTLWPASGRISSNFGGREDPFQFGKKFHEGIDVAAQYGQDIKASGSGNVTFSGWYSGYGYAIIINHGHGITTLYGHASKLLAKKGTTVKKGDIIAKVGSSGRSTGAHLHFEVRINDVPIDPLKYLDKGN